MDTGRLAAIPLTWLLAAAAVFLPLQHGTAAGWIAAGFAVPLVLYSACYAIGAEGRIGFRHLAAAAVMAISAAALIFAAAGGAGADVVAMHGHSAPNR